MSRGTRLALLVKDQTASNQEGLEIVRCLFRGVARILILWLAITQVWRLNTVLLVFEVYESGSYRHTKAMSLDSLMLCKGSHLKVSAIVV